MKLVLIRHARAESRRLLQRDRTRALTREGQKRMHKAARGLQQLLPSCHRMASSPLLRARQTAEVLAKIWPRVAQEQLPALTPGGSPHDVLQWLRRQANGATLALVGHEPDLGQLAGWLLTGRQTGFVQFKKGAAMLIEFESAPRAGGGTLGWYLTARQLAALRG